MSEIEVARALLEIGAVGFSPHQPVTFKSGMLSPVYVDNRRLIAHPQQWHLIIESLQAVIKQAQIDYDVIAGIETAGIPHSSVLAYVLHAPSVFVRKHAKEHGRQRRVEGDEVSGRRVLLVEDLVTTGGSSLSGVAALRESGAVVEDCLAITSYGFDMARIAFTAAGARLHTLTPFAVIAAEALAMGYFGQAEMTIIEDWLSDPHGWANRREMEI
jgi:orotate phosphoribosyltransferase